MSTERIFHCDRSENHRLSYEKASGTSSDPVKAEWWIVEEREQENGVILHILRMQLIGQKGDMHFCSDRCLKGWFEKRIEIFKRQIKSTKENS